jgi:hypothetical protein
MGGTSKDYQFSNNLFEPLSRPESFHDLDLDLTGASAASAQCEPLLAAAVVGKLSENQIEQFLMLKMSMSRRLRLPLGK